MDHHMHISEREKRKAKMRFVRIQGRVLMVRRPVTRQESCPPAVYDDSYVFFWQCVVLLRCVRPIPCFLSLSYPVRVAHGRLRPFLVALMCDGRLLCGVVCATRPMRSLTEWLPKKPGNRSRLIRFYPGLDRIDASDSEMLGFRLI
jgi:hypothetical protein